MQRTELKKTPTPELIEKVSVIYSITVLDVKVDFIPICPIRFRKFELEKKGQRYYLSHSLVSRGIRRCRSQKQMLPVNKTQSTFAGKGKTHR